MKKEKIEIQIVLNIARKQDKIEIQKISDKKIRWSKQQHNGQQVELFEPPEPKEFSGNRSDSRFDGCDDDCYLCGMPVRSENSYQVHTVYGLDCIPVDAEWTCEASDTGWWTIGSQCSRKIPFRFKRKSLRLKTISEQKKIEETS